MIESIQIIIAKVILFWPMEFFFGIVPEARQNFRIPSETRQVTQFTSLPSFHSRSMLPDKTEFELNFRFCTRIIWGTTIVFSHRELWWYVSGSNSGATHTRFQLQINSQQTRRTFQAYKLFSQNGIWLYRFDVHTYSKSILETCLISTAKWFINHNYVI